VRITDGGTNFSLLPAPGAGWVSPVAVTVSTSGVVYVSNFDNACIVAVASWGYGAITVITDGLSQPTGLWLAPNGDLYAADFNNMWVVKYLSGSTTAATEQTSERTERTQTANDLVHTTGLCGCSCR
jgi:hypothetical protein